MRGFCEPHLPAGVLLDMVPESVRTDYFKFAFIRNPWDLVVSTYHYLKKVFAEHAHLGLVDPDYDHILKTGGFGDFVRAYPMINADMTSFISDSDGHLLVDFVGRCERIEEDFEVICRRIGVTATLRHENVTEHAHYREYYNGATRAIVEEHFRRDIERFGYKF